MSVTSKRTLDKVKRLKESVSIDALSKQEIKMLLQGFNQKIYAGVREYVITVLLLDRVMRNTEAIKIRDIDFSIRFDKDSVNC